MRGQQPYNSHINGRQLEQKETILRTGNPRDIVASINLMPYTETQVYNERQSPKSKQ